MILAGTLNQTHIQDSCYVIVVLSSAAITSNKQIDCSVREPPL